jgi:hypothetical protein
MPVKPLHPRKSSAAGQELKRLLVQEWRENNATGQPVILIEDTGRATHVFVVWDQWSALTREERSEVIMEAYEEVVGLDKSFNVTVALGLTPVEAERMNIKY